MGESVGSVRGWQFDAAKQVLNHIVNQRLLLPFDQPDQAKSERHLSEGTMLVQQGVVNGRIGRVKTEASEDEIPLDPSFVEALIEWRNKTSAGGLVFIAFNWRLFSRRDDSKAAGYGLALFPPHVAQSAGRDGCAGRSSTETDASRQRGHDNEHLRQCRPEGQAGCKFEGRPNGADVSDRSAALRYCGVWVLAD